LSGKDLMQKIFMWTKKRLTTEEIKMRYYYAKTLREGTPNTLQLIGAN